MQNDSGVRVCLSSTWPMVLSKSFQISRPPTFLFPFPCKPVLAFCVMPSEEGHLLAIWPEEAVSITYKTCSMGYRLWAGVSHLTSFQMADL